ncbi:MAG: hypothetical protein IT384_08510 [Deltaproteobacteria bacterium]|nr:hypothetical protein [Deltaproteobacteria bacterium]
MRRSSWLSTLAGLGGCLVPALASAGAITGTVTVAVPPVPSRAAILVDAHVCGQTDPVYARRVEIDALGAAAGVVVSLERLEGPWPKLKKLTPRSAVIDQKNCTFVPRVLAVSSGTEVRFRNSDPLFHSVHARRPDGSTLVSFAMPLAGQEIPAFVAKGPGPIELTCDAGHTWMRAQVEIFEHPYFDLTNARGAFRIDAVPPGRYRLIARHPDLGRREISLDVGARGRQVIKVEF